MGLSRHFANELPDAAATAAAVPTFVEEYFTCPARCTVCKARCQLAVGHDSSANEPASSHQARTSDLGDGCQYSATLQNKAYYCKVRSSIVILSFSLVGFHSTNRVNITALLCNGSFSDVGTKNTGRGVIWCGNGTDEVSLVGICPTLSTSWCSLP